jgi:hypothetical protein
VDIPTVVVAQQVAHLSFNSRPSEGKGPLRVDAVGKVFWVLARATLIQKQQWIRNIDSKIAAR